MPVALASRAAGEKHWKEGGLLEVGSKFDQGILMDNIISKCAIVADLDSRLDAVVRADVDFELDERLLLTRVGNGKSPMLLSSNTKRGVLAEPLHPVDRAPVDRLERRTDDHLRERGRRLIHERTLREGLRVAIVRGKRDDVVDIGHVEGAAILNKEIGLISVVENVSHGIERADVSNIGRGKKSFALTVDGAAVSLLGDLYGRTAKEPGLPRIRTRFRNER